jgi:hypothetical protein
LLTAIINIYEDYPGRPVLMSRYEKCLPYKMKLPDGKIILVEVTIAILSEARGDSIAQYWVDDIKILDNPKKTMNTS